MNPNSEDRMHCSALVVATLSQQPAIIEKLIRANCDVNKPGLVSGNFTKPLQIAVNFGNRTIAEMLYIAGCATNNISLTDEMQELSEDFKNWLKYVSQNPLTLKQQCRTTIRKLLHCKVGIITYKLRLLPLPEQIKNYLNLDELESLVQQTKQQNILEESTHSNSATLTDDWISTENISLVQSPSF